jgi:hypothetical protein
MAYFGLVLWKKVVYILSQTKNNLSILHSISRRSKFNMELKMDDDPAGKP